MRAAAPEIAGLFAAGATPAGPERIAALDGLRGVACLLVVIGHYFGEVAHGFHCLTLDWIGVDLFFCLSGFLIGGILFDNRGSPSYFATFYIRRGFRIFPIYVVIVSLVLLALPRVAAAPGPLFSPAIYFGYTQNFLMAATGVETHPWLMPTWSLCIEEQFYLMLPVMLYLTSPRRIAALLVLTIVSAGLFRAALVLHGANPLALTMLPPARWDLLFLGVGGAWVRRSPVLWQRLAAANWRLLKAILFAGLGALLVLIAADNTLAWRSVDMLGPTALGVSLVALVLIVASGGPEARRFRAPGLCFLGRISYGLYLMHQPIAGLMHALLLGGRPDIATPPQVAVTLLALAASVAAAALSWRFFESPLIRLGHLWRYREAG